MSIELDAERSRDQRLKKRLALDKRQRRHVPAVQVQQIEGVIDKPNPALAIGSGLGVGEARQASIIDAAEFASRCAVFTFRLARAAMALGYLSLQSRPVQSQELRAAMIDPRRHAKSVQLYLVQPLRP